MKPQVVLLNNYAAWRTGDSEDLRSAFYDVSTSFLYYRWLLAASGGFLIASRKFTHETLREAGSKERDDFFHVESAFSNNDGISELNQHNNISA